MKKVTKVCSVLFILVFINIAFAGVKIGVVDLNKVLLDIPQTKNVQADLKKQFEQRGQALSNSQNVLQGDMAQYNENKTTMTQNEVRKAQQKIITEGKNIRQARASLQHDFVVARGKLLQPILKQIDGVVRDIATAQRIDLIITKISLGYASPKLEITDQVIATMGKLASNDVN